MLHYIVVLVSSMISSLTNTKFRSLFLNFQTYFLVTSVIDFYLNCIWKSYTLFLLWFPQKLQHESLIHQSLKLTNIFILFLDNTRSLGCLHLTYLSFVFCHQKLINPQDTATIVSQRKCLFSFIYILAIYCALRFFCLLYPSVQEYFPYAQTSPFRGCFF